MTKDNLMFRGVDTGVKKSVKPIDVLTIVNIDMFGKEYYLKLLEYGLFVNKDLKIFLDKYFEINNENNEATNNV